MRIRVKRKPCIPFIHLRHPMYYFKTLIEQFFAGTFLLNQPEQNILYVLCHTITPPLFTKHSPGIESKTNIMLDVFVAEVCLLEFV